MGFSRQEYWSGLPLSPLGGLPDPRVKPRSPVLAGRFFTTEPPGKPRYHDLQINLFFFHFYSLVFPQNEL